MSEDNTANSTQPRFLMRRVGSEWSGCLWWMWHNADILLVYCTTLPE